MLLKTNAVMESILKDLHFALPQRYTFLMSAYLRMCSCLIFSYTTTFGSQTWQSQTEVSLWEVLPNSIGL